MVAICPSVAWAQCSRAIVVPVLPSGLTVIVKDNQFQGIIPDLLSQVSQKSGCKFSYHLVPKNRQEALFETGHADLLITAVRTARRDQFGEFVSLIQLRATLISIESGQPSITSSAELLSRTSLKLLVVRGFDYGATYQKVLQEMQAQGRLIQEGDTVSVARSMKANHQYVTIMAPTIFAGMLQTEARLADMVGKVRYEKLEDFPWSDSGIYISNKSLSDTDRLLLKTNIEKLAVGDTIWKAYQQHYSVDVVRLGLRPRDSR